jgi:hypothetical protein
VEALGSGSSYFIGGSTPAHLLISHSQAATIFSRILISLKSEHKSSQPDHASLANGDSPAGFGLEKCEGAN